MNAFLRRVVGRGSTSLRNYGLRIVGAAESIDDYQGPLRHALRDLGSRYLSFRPDAHDLLVNVVFEVPDDATKRNRVARELERAARRALPPKLHERVVAAEAPDRPHEISAQLLVDKRRGAAILPGALQAPEDLTAWEEFLSLARPRGVIELGTGSGAFARWLGARVEWLRTIDVGTPEPATPGFVQLDVWARPDAVRDLIAQAPRPFVLYCDDGDKPLEVETFGPALRVGDFLAVHDLGTEILQKDIPSGFAERLAFGLTAFYEKTAAC